ncbi:hypothetical protein E4U55_001666 [Claviceps digitariae]|nr:hypothetical protein E4U55_001666 [Claviceps digitariae]
MPQSLPFFTRSLAAFLSSPDPFRILATCTSSSSSSTSSASPSPPTPHPPPKGIKTLIVLDSSFNPPTSAHAQMARSALRATGPNSRLLLLLAVRNADKGSGMAGLAWRLGMMEGLGRELLAAAEEEEEEEEEDGRWGRGGAVDVGVTKMPFFGDKATSIAEVGGYVGLGGMGQPEQVYLCGFDTLVRILDGKYYGGAEAGDTDTETPMQRALRPFFAMARLRVTMRPDDEWGSADEQRAYVEGLEKGGLERLGGDADWARRIELVEGTGGVVSSSRVRKMVREMARRDGGGGGDELNGLVGREVKRWIEEEGLYRE